jgi:hypothetical protein
LWSGRRLDFSRFRLRPHKFLGDLLPWQQLVDAMQAVSSRSQHSVD